MNRDIMRKISNRLITIRADMLDRYPFFGRLLMHLPFGFADCETAFTDMRRIVFDPDFAARLSDRELSFVMLHELMHCVLKHCTRAEGKMHLLYNIACDIVVNSVILDAMGEKEMLIDGWKVMHLAPDGKEGREYSAEQVYLMLLNQKSVGNTMGLPDAAEGNYSLDDHSVWGSIDIYGSILEETWNTYISNASKSSGKNGSGIPCGLKRFIEGITKRNKIDWRQVLHDFIQHDRYDYDFIPPDNRFGGDVILPSFSENKDGGKIEKLWFLIDTSGSISNKAISEAMSEIGSAIDQIGNLSGYISFFDTQVSEPVEFDSIKKLSSIEPVGGGGTSFSVIFDSMHGYFEDELPAGIIIITDGYAEFPDESVSLNVPVIWIIVDSEVTATFGECIRINSD